MASNESSAQTTASPHRWAWVAVLVLALGGVALAAKLTDIHVRVYLDPGYHSFCAVSEALSCDTVAQSRWSVAFGAPVSMWGILAYTAMLLVSVWGLRGGRGAPGAILLLGTVGLLGGGGMAVISVLKVHSLCPMCLGTYVIDLVVFVLALSIARRPGLATNVRALLAAWRRLLPWAAVAVAVAVLIAAFYPAYWKRGRATVQLSSGVDDSGSHWIGAVAPKLTIVEFSDYQCPHCQRGHELMRSLVLSNPDGIRLVHRNYPLDQHCNPKISGPFHDQACRDAALAICAGDLGKFWAANDYLFDHNEQTVDARAMANELGIDSAALERCLSERAYQSRLDADVRTGIGLEIDGTPTYFVNGKKYPGRIPAEVLAPYAPH